MNRAKILWIALAAVLVLLRVGWSFYQFRQATNRGRYVERMRAAETVRTTAMTPTIRVGESVEIEKKTNFDHGDIVLLAEPVTDDAIVLRIVGIAGDRIEIRDKRLFLNGVALEEPYAVHDDAEIIPKEKDPRRDQFGPLVVPNDHCFVLGDNRDHSTDSRYFGTVPAANVKGRVTYVMGMGGWRRVNK